MSTSPSFQPLLWLEIGMKTSNIRMMILFNACFTGAWRWLTLNIGERVHPNLMAIHSTGHIGAIGILLKSEIYITVLVLKQLKGGMWRKALGGLLLEQMMISDSKKIKVLPSSFSKLYLLACPIQLSIKFNRGTFVSPIFINFILFIMRVIDNGLSCLFLRWFLLSCSEGPFNHSIEPISLLLQGSCWGQGSVWKSYVICPYPEGPNPVSYWITFSVVFSCC